MEINFLIIHVNYLLRRWEAEFCEFQKIFRMFNVKAEKSVRKNGRETKEKKVSWEYSNIWCLQHDRKMKLKLVKMNIDQCFPNRWYPLHSVLDITSPWQKTDLLLLKKDNLHHQMSNSLILLGKDTKLYSNFQHWSFTAYSC